MRQIGEFIEGKPLFFVDLHQSVRSVAVTMADKNIGAVAVLDSDQLVGVFTERDLMTRVVAPGLSPDDTEVSSVMTREVAVAAPNDGIQECLQRMHSLNCRHLPVVDEGHLVGMISLRDLLQVDRKWQQEKATFLTELVSYSPDYES